MNKLLRGALAHLLSNLRARMRFGFGIEPLSYRWGTDRGIPVHRFYTENFLSEWSNDIRGHCLEFQEDRYTSRFSGGRHTKLDILHRDGGNPNATLIADLTTSNTIPSDSYDCIICTFVLHVIFDLKTAVSELYRILKPGGVLLLAVPKVSMDGPEYSELWRFTSSGLFALLEQAFDQRNVCITAYGNSLTTAGDFRGLVTQEFTSAELSFHDPRFAMVICARAVK